MRNVIPKTHPRQRRQFDVLREKNRFVRYPFVSLQLEDNDFIKIKLLDTCKGHEHDGIIIRMVKIYGLTKIKPLSGKIKHMLFSQEN